MRGGKTLTLLGSTAVVGAGTAATQLAGLPVQSLAATPRAVEDGRVWLLVTSGLLADDPWVPSLLGFAIVLTVSVRVLSGPLVAMVAAAGQIGSALVVYAVIWMARFAEPHAFGSVYRLDDYGTSTMIAAWIGAVGYVGWNRFPDRGGHVLVVVGCLGCLGIGLACRPDVTFLDSEHLIAFAIGATLPAVLPRTSLAALRHGARIAATAVGVVPLSRRLAQRASEVVAAGSARRGCGPPRAGFAPAPGRAGGRH